MTTTEPETQVKTTNTINKQQENTEKITCTKGGLQPTRHAFSTACHNSAKGIDNVLIEMKLDNKSDYTINFARNNEILL